MFRAPGSGWWLASDGNWYPPDLAPGAPEPAPVVEAAPVAPVTPRHAPVAEQTHADPVQHAAPTPPPGWWLASDGNWYPPELASR